MERLFDLLENEPETRSQNLPVLSRCDRPQPGRGGRGYPVARDEAGASEEVEHSRRSTSKPNRSSSACTPQTPAGTEFNRVTRRIGEAVSHHVEEEESSVLPAMRSGLDDSRRQELADAFSRSRAEHLGEKPGKQPRTTCSRWPRMPSSAVPAR